MSCALRVGDYSLVLMEAPVLLRLSPQEPTASLAPSRALTRDCYFLRNFLKNGSSSGIYCLYSGVRTRFTPSRRVHHGSMWGHSATNAMLWFSSQLARRMYWLRWCVAGSMRTHPAGASTPIPDSRASITEGLSVVRATRTAFAYR